MTAGMRVRMAPSPTGDIHIGNARTALMNYLMARQAGGAFILRVEDTDRERSDPQKRPASMTACAGCPLDWDEGPDIGGPYGPYLQSKRHEVHPRGHRGAAGVGRGVLRLHDGRGARGANRRRPDAALQRQRAAH